MYHITNLYKYVIEGKSCNRTLAVPKSWADSNGLQAAHSGNLCTYVVDEKSCNKVLHAGHRGVCYGETHRIAIALQQDAACSGYIHIIMFLSAGRGRHAAAMVHDTVGSTTSLLKQITQ